MTAKMLSLWRNLTLALLVIHSILLIADGFKSAMAPARRSFLQMGPVNAIKSLVRTTDLFVFAIVDTIEDKGTSEKSRPSAMHC